MSDANEYFAKKFVEAERLLSNYEHPENYADALISIKLRPVESESVSGRLLRLPCGVRGDLRLPRNSRNNTRRKAARLSRTGPGNHVPARQR